MRISSLITWAAAASLVRAAAWGSRSLDLSMSGVEALINRRIQQHADSFEFAIVNASDTGVFNDSYVISSTEDGKVLVQGNSVSALLSGLRRYLADVVHVDIWWFIGNRLDAAPANLPRLPTPLSGSSIVPYRYHFNTVTTSYTSAFWTWEDWELQLDWMALHGVNLPLAWIGVEKIFIEVFREIGLTDAEIETFLSGPAFLAWNHMGNIQGSWGGPLSFEWVEGQFELQKKIVKRMVELGMTPILPAFPGYVPQSISRIYPNASVINGSRWEAFPREYTNATFLNPLDPLFEKLQTSFVAKQKAVYGNVSGFYALDQFNENNPSSGDNTYLASVSYNTWKTLKAADSDAVWVMQGWLFTSNSAFWTNDRIGAFLGGVPVDSDMLILDLVSESQPQWQRTNSYGGKPWIWCQLHGYGQNMGLYGQIMNITINPIEALSNSTSLVGFGLTMEGQEGNEIVYDLLLDQAWSREPIDTESYFRSWVTTRYSNRELLPESLYAAWETLRPTVYNNTNLTANSVPKSILELIPSKSGLTGRTGHHPTVLNYNATVMVYGWGFLYRAGMELPSLFTDPAYSYDLVDWTRQVLANAFIPLYEQLVVIYQDETVEGRIDKLKKQGERLIFLLTTLDLVLDTNENFRLSKWISAARASATRADMADFMEYEARNQITLWGPTGQISDYASKSWSGLVSSYYIPRWQMFIDYLVQTSPTNYNQTDFKAELLDWELTWANQTSPTSPHRYESTKGGSIKEVLPEMLSQWNDIFSI